MEVKVTLREIIIKDETTGEEFPVRTLRTAKEIADYIDETERDIVADKLEEALNEAYEDSRKN